MTKPSPAILLVRKRTQLLTKLRNEARRQSVTPENIQHQFAFDVFLTRMFSPPDSPWVLKGGTSLLLRIGSGRRSRDIDLARRQHLRPADALIELNELVNTPGPTDPDFSFILQEPARDNQDPTDPTRGSFKVIMQIGTMDLVRFSVDLSTQQHLDAPVDQVPINPVIEYEGLPPGTLIPMVAVENVVADKLCACYEHHPATGESTRFHDLIDLVRIVTTQHLDADRLQTLLTREVRHRSNVALPRHIVAPGPRWEESYPKQAAAAADFDPRYHDLETALATVGECLNDFLAGHPVKGTWDPHDRTWH